MEGNKGMRHLLMILMSKSNYLEIHISEFIIKHSDYEKLLHIKIEFLFLMIIFKISSKTLTGD